MPIVRLNPSEWRPVPGDDGPYLTMSYRDVPKGFRITDLEPVANAPLTAQYWTRLTQYADLHFRNHEVVGKTLMDFFNNIQDSYYLNADTLEKALEVYYEDIAKPTQSRTIKRTHTEDETLPDPSTTRTTQYGQSIHTEGSSDTDTTNVEFAIENDDGSPSSKDTTHGSNDITEAHSGTDTEAKLVVVGVRSTRS